MSASCALVSLTIEHLRGFDRAVLPLTRENLLLVGPNNSGKTSLLRLLNWVLAEADEDLLLGRRLLSEDERALLLPARDTRGGARRLTLAVSVADGRRHRAFEATNGLAFLRLQIADGGKRVVARLGKPKRGEARDSQPRAVQLLQEVQQCHPAIFIAPSRDASSEAFVGALRGAVRQRLADRLVHEERGGAPAEYRKAATALRSIETLAQRQAAGLIDDLRAGLPGAMTKATKVDFDATPLALVDWLAERAALMLSTGEHDERMVSPVELGSGLQSILLMHLLNAPTESDAIPLLLLEEPEAFLHPSAQRTLARSLFADQEFRLVASTHSTVVVDEATAADIMLVRGHRVFSPSDVDERRRSINSALLTGQGSEAIFSRSVLLVEGPGDRAFFETLRRRLDGFVPADLLSDLGIVAVGGKQRFAPWFQLLEAYADKHSGHRPVAYLALGDSADAAADLARAYRDARLSLPADLDRLGRSATSAFREGRVDDHLQATSEFNALAESNSIGLAMTPIDLEYSMLAAASESSAQALAEKFSITCSTPAELMYHLGSKFRGTAKSDAAKGDWMRAAVAEDLPWQEVGEPVRHIIRRWLQPILDDHGLPIPSGLT